jgi:hypothetical protein
MNLDEELKKADAEVCGAEDALIDAGFSFDHWKLIRTYILFSIYHNQLLQIKTLQNMGSAPAKAEPSNPA